MKRQSLARDSQGFAFVAVLMVMLVMAILVTAVLTMAMSTRNLSTSRHEYTEALYVAEAGVNKVISTWRRSGVPAVPGYADGTLTSAGRTGAYHVSWDYWRPYDNDSLIRYDVVVLTSAGTINTALSAKMIYNLTRTVRVNFDTNGDWAWNHVYTSDDPDPDYQVPPYADANGNSGDIVPGDYLDEHGPGSNPKLPTPKWDEWEATARAYDTLPYPSVLTGNKISAAEGRRVYWYGQSTSAHTGTGHTHFNYFAPDPYFGLSYPAAYGCSDLTVEFTKHDGIDYTGVYYVHGNVIVKSGVTLTGTIVATGDITLQGQAITIIPLVVNPQDCAARTVYPALIAGRDIVIADQSQEFHTLGIIWAGRSFTSKASNQSGCIVSPHVVLGGAFNVTYGFDTNNPECPRYEPGSSPPPMFNEPDMGQMQPVPHSWREM